MLIGIMTRTFHRPTLEEVADAVRLAGLATVQLNLVSAGLPPLPDRLERDAARRIGDVFFERGLSIAAVSANFNCIHPDPCVRTAAVKRFALLASRSKDLGTHILTMCTGTRNPDNMWHAHPDNADAEAWQDLVGVARDLTRIAEDCGVTVAFEPEVFNVVNTAAKAERLIAEVGSTQLRVLLDPANLVHPCDLPDTRPMLQDAFARLGPFIAMAHAKDVLPPLPDSDECRRVAAGAGMLDYPEYVRGLVHCGFQGPLVMHDLDQTEVENCSALLRRLLSAETC